MSIIKRCQERVLHKNNQQNPLKCIGGPIEPFLSCLFFCMYFFCEGEVVWWGYAEMWRFNPLMLTTYISCTSSFCELLMKTAGDKCLFAVFFFLEFTVHKNLRNWGERTIKLMYNQWVIINFLMKLEKKTAYLYFTLTTYY